MKAHGLKKNNADIGNLIDEVLNLFFNDYEFEFF